VKIFLCCITILLLISRIKNTPSALSKKLYDKKTIDSLKKLNATIGDMKHKEEIALSKFITLGLTFLCLAFCIFYYAMVASFVGSQLILLLSVIQILTVGYTIKTQLKLKLFDEYSENHISKFRRLYFLFNVILDYIYYPITLYYLLIK